MTAQRYRIELVADQDPSHRARIVFVVTRRSEAGLKHRLDVGAAVAADASSFLHLPSPAEGQVLRSEIMAGLLAGMRGQWTGWEVVLEQLGAEVGGSRDIAGIASIPYAVAAALCLRHATGAEDLVSAPHGGHGWRLAAFTVEIAV